MQVANKVVFNTVVQYVRLLITIGFSFYSTRILLNALGDSDYGLYSLIAGVVLLLTFLNAAMSVTTQRYLSFALGRGEFALQKKIFVNSFLLHLCLAVVMIIIIEFVGLFIFDGFLNIPADKFETAKIIYHFMAGSVFFTVLSVPFTATLIAHENILWISVVYISEAVLKFLIALLLLYFFQQKLVVYGMFMLVVSIISFILYMYYCVKKYSECFRVSIRFYDNSVMKELTSFAGWNLLNVGSNIGENQGVAILLNRFLGVSVNAGYGIASQIASQLNFFSQSLLNAINPQIMKSEGIGDSNRTLRLAMLASKYSFLLLAFFAIPCIFEMPSILNIWLKSVPDYCVAFSRWMLLAALLNQATVGLASANQATGKIRDYTIGVCSIRLLVLPIGFLLLRFGCDVQSVFIVYVLLVGVSSCFRIYFLRKTLDLSFNEFMSCVLLKIFFPSMISILVCLCIIQLCNWEYRFLLTCFVSALFFVIGVYYQGMSREERLFFKDLLMKLFK